MASRRAAPTWGGRPAHVDCREIRTSRPGPVASGASAAARGQPSPLVAWTPAIPSTSRHAAFRHWPGRLPVRGRVSMNGPQREAAPSALRTARACSIIPSLCRMLSLRRLLVAVVTAVPILLAIPTEVVGQPTRRASPRSTATAAGASPSRGELAGAVTDLESSDEAYRNRGFLRLQRAGAAAVPLLLPRAADADPVVRAAVVMLLAARCKLGDAEAARALRAAGRTQGALEDRALYLLPFAMCRPRTAWTGEAAWYAPLVTNDTLGRFAFQAINTLPDEGAQAMPVYAAMLDSLATSTPHEWEESEHRWRPLAAFVFGPEPAARPFHATLRRLFANREFADYYKMALGPDAPAGRATWRVGMIAGLAVGRAPKTLCAPLLLEAMEVPTEVIAAVAGMAGCQTPETREALLGILQDTSYRDGLWGADGELRSLSPEEREALDLAEELRVIALTSITAHGAAVAPHAIPLIERLLAVPRMRWLVTETDGEDRLPVREVALRALRALREAQSRPAKRTRSP